MKLKTVFLFLSLIISITSEIDWDSYSIDEFKEYLEKEGLFEIIESILKAYEQDIAILCCEELVGNRNGNCKKLVTEYMDPSNEYPSPSKRASDIEDEHLKCIEKLYYSMFTNSEDIQNSIVIKNELSKKYPESHSNLIFNKIVERVRDLGPCKE